MNVILIMTIIALGGESSTHTQGFKNMTACSQAQDAWVAEVKAVNVEKVKVIALCAPNF